MLNTVNKEATMPVGKLILAVSSFDKYQQDLNDDELQLELVTIFLTESEDIRKLKDTEYFEKQKSLVFASVSTELYREVLDFFPLIVVQHWLESMGLPPAAVSSKLNQIKLEVSEKQKALSLGLEKFLEITPEVFPKATSSLPKKRLKSSLSTTSVN